ERGGGVSIAIGRGLTLQHIDRRGGERLRFLDKRVIDFDAPRSGVGATGGDGERQNGDGARGEGRDALRDRRSTRPTPECFQACFFSRFHHVPSCFKCCSFNLE